MNPINSSPSIATVLATPMRRADFLLAILSSRMLFLLPEMVLLVLVGWLYVYISAGWLFVGLGLLTLLAGLIAFFVWSARRREWPFRTR